MTPADDKIRREGGLAEAALRLAAREASRVPLFAISTGLQMWQRTRGIRETALRQGSVALQIVAHTPLGRFLPQPSIDDDAQQEADRIVAHARETRQRLTPVATPPKPAAQPTRPKPQPAPSEEVDRIAARLDVGEPESHDDLPIPDFDNITLGSLRARLRSLSIEQLVTLREWEKSHGNRLPVLTLLDNRVAKLSAEAPATASAAYPSETPPTADPAAKQAGSAADGEAAH